MVSAIFLDTYQRYKRQTDQIAQWLVETAGKEGFKTSPEESTVQDVPSKSTTFRIPLYQFIDLGRFIVQASKSDTQIPRQLLNTIQCVIDKRKQFSSQYYSSDSNPGPAASSHAYFIETLERLKHILSPAARKVAREKVFTKPSAQTPGNIKDGSPKFDTQNRFDLLHVEEAQDNDKGPQNDTELPLTQSQCANRRIILDVDNNNESRREEMYFAVYCLLLDYRAMQQYLETVWKDYSKSAIDLIEAAVITNTAFYLARRTQEHLYETFPELNKRPDVNGMSFDHFLQCRGKNPNNQAPMPALLHDGPEKFLLFFYIHAQRILEGYCISMEPGKMPPAGKRYHYNPKEDRRLKTFDEKQDEDVAMIGIIMYELWILTESKTNFDGEDELIKGFREMHTTKQVPVCLSFAFQIWLDINHILRENVLKGRLDLLKAGLKAQAALEPTLTQEIQAFKDPELQAKDAKKRWDWVEREVKRDRIDDIKRESLKNLYSTEDYNPKPFYLFNRHPVACGMLKLWLTLQIREFGCTISRCTGAVLSLSHLYNALRQNRYLDIEWPAIEDLILTASAAKLFVGGLPTDMTTCLKRYQLMMAFSATMFASDRDGGRHKYDRVTLSQKGWREWHIEPPIISIFEDCYFLQNKAVEWSTARVEAVLRKRDQGRSQGRGETDCQRSSLQLLMSLREALAQEYKELTYDYFGIHHLSLDFLRTLRKELKEDLNAIFDKKYADREDSMGAVVGHLLGAQARGQLVTFTGELEQMRVKAAAVMKAFIKKHP